MWEKLKRIWSQSPGISSRSTRASSQTQRTQAQTQQTKPKTQEARTEKQKIRLAIENEILKRKASRFCFFKHKQPAETYVVGWIKTSDGYRYELKVLLGPKFPDQMPRLFVVSPHKAPKYGGGFINNAGLSHKFHTRGKGPNGCVEICHCKESSWDPSRNILSVLIKGVIWCEAHRKYVKTGETIAHFCDELKDQVPDLNNY